MNYNIITYSIYLPIIGFIMIKVGWLFYKNGYVYLSHLTDDLQLIQSINNLLLIGYYLLNLGYAIITISFWEDVYTIAQIIESLTKTLGKIILILAGLHYNNVLCLNYLIFKNHLKS